MVKRDFFLLNGKMNIFLGRGKGSFGEGEKEDTRE